MDEGQAFDDEGLAAVAKQIDQLIAERQYQTALGLAKPLADRTATLHGTHSAEYAQQLNQLADIYRELHKYEDAEPIYRNAAEIFSRTRGENDAAVSTSLNGLAVTLIKMREYAAAEPPLRRALQ